MESYMSFLFATDAVNYINKYNLNATIRKNKRTGRYDVIRTYVSALVGKVMAMEDQMYAISFIIFAYGLYVAVELVRRTQLLCAQYAEAISREYGSDYNLLYFCSLSRLLFRYVLEWDKVG